MAIDFADIVTAAKEEKIRAWASEQSCDFVIRSGKGQNAPYQHVITLAKMLEDYVVHGDVTGVIQAAVEEGYSEGRFEAKEAIAEWTGREDLDVLFESKGWNTGPQEGEG